MQKNAFVASLCPEPHREVLQDFPEPLFGLTKDRSGHRPRPYTTVVVVVYSGQDCNTANPPRSSTTTSV